MYKRPTKVLSVLLALCMLLMTFAVSLTAQAAETDVQPNFDYIGAYGSLSEDEVESACLQIYNQLSECKSTITVDLGRTISADDAGVIANLIFEVSHNHAVGMLFDGRKELSYSYGSRFSANVSYFANGSVDTYNELIASLDNILAGVRTDWTDVEKALYLHDTIAVDFDYDNAGLTTGNDKHYVYEFLTTNNEAVCDAYASLYSYLMNRLGIRCVKIASTPNVHAWNAVEIDGAWYYVDITHDDSFHGYHPGMLSHEYFLNSETENVNTRNNAGSDTWNASQWTLICKKSLQDTNLNISKTDSVHGFWEGIETAIEPIGSEWLIADNAKDPDDRGPYTIKIVNINGDETEIYRKDTGDWEFTNGNYITWYPGKFMVPVYYGNVVFFTTGSAVYGLYNNADGTEPYEVAALNSSNSQDKIYGLKQSGDKLIYYYSDYPFSNYTGTGYDHPGTPVELDLEECASKVRLSAVSNESVRRWKATYYLKNSTGNFDFKNSESMDGFETPMRLKFSDIQEPFYYQSDWFTDQEMTVPFDFSKVLKNDVDLYGEYYYCQPIGVDATLDGNIRMNYLFNINEMMLNDPTARVDFYIQNGDEIRTVTVPFSEAEPVVDEELKNTGATHSFSVEIYSREMDATINVAVQSDHVNFYWSSAQFNSVNEYLDSVMNIPGLAQKEMNMANATKVYGMYANQYFDDVPTETTENFNLTSDQWNELTGRKANYSGTNAPSAQYVGSSLVLENTTAIRHYFKVEDPSDVREVKVDGEAAELIRKSDEQDMYYVEIKNISADNLNKNFIVDVEGFTMDYSACSYMYTVINKINPSTESNEKNVQLCNTMMAMFLYALAAEDMAA